MPDVDGSTFRDSLGVQILKDAFPGTKKQTSAYKSAHHLNMSTDPKRLTTTMLNEQNARFWAEQKIFLEQRISGPVLYDLTKGDMDFEAARGVPVKQQKTIEQALADAAYARSTVRAELSRKRRKAPQSDALQELILDIVRADPTISEKERPVIEQAIETATLTLERGSAFDSIAVQGATTLVTPRREDRAMA